MTLKDEVEQLEKEVKEIEDEDKLLLKRKALKKRLRHKSLLGKTLKLLDRF